MEKVAGLIPIHTIGPAPGRRAQPPEEPTPGRSGMPSPSAPARITAATCELLILIRRFDEAGGWNNGFASCAHWLNWRTGLALGAAREKVRVARALAALPQLSAALQRGEVSFSKIRALTRIATPENEARLVHAAQGGTAAHIERLVRAWRRTNRVEEARETGKRHQTRGLSCWVDEDGMLVIRGRLTPEVGAVVQRALEAATDQLRQEQAEMPPPGTLAEETSPAQRRADALGLVAESALAGRLDPGPVADRYQVVVHVEATESQAALESPDGQRVSAETSRRIGCEASRVVMHHGPGGSVLDVGRKTRTIPPAIRRALAARDRRCQFPGCAARHYDAHHLHHWADGGPTRLDNLVLLCRRHHRAVHEEGFTVAIDEAGGFRFRRPNGRVVELVPPAPPWRHWGRQSEPQRQDSAGDRDDPLAPFAAGWAAAGLTIGPNTATPHWHGEQIDYGWALDILRNPHPWVPPGKADDVPAET